MTFAAYARLPRPRKPFDDSRFCSPLLPCLAVRRRSGHRPARDARPVRTEVRRRRKGPYRAALIKEMVADARRTATPGGGPPSFVPPHPRVCPATRSASRAATSGRTFDQGALHSAGRDRRRRLLAEPDREAGVQGDRRRGGERAGHPRDREGGNGYRNSCCGCRRQTASHPEKGNRGTPRDRLADARRSDGGDDRGAAPRPRSLSPGTGQAHGLEELYARTGQVHLWPRAASAGGLAESKSSRQPRSSLRLSTPRSAALPLATTAAAAAARMARPRRRHVRPLGQSERQRLVRRPLEPDRSRLAPVRRVPRRQADRARGVCVRLGDHGEMAACFNPDTLQIEALWTGGFVTLQRPPLRLHGRHPARRPDAADAGQDPGDAAVCLPRLLPPRQADRSSPTASATWRCSTPRGWRTGSSSARSPRPTGTRSPTSRAAANRSGRR